MGERTSRLWLVAIASVAILALMAGCFTLADNGSSDDNRTDTVEGNGDARPLPGVGLSIQEIDVNERGFILETRVEFTLGPDEDYEFEDVMLCLYDEEGTVLNSTNLGTFKDRYDVRSNVSITADERPEYIFVDHPEFSEHPRMSVEVFYWRPNDTLPDNGVYPGRDTNADEISDRLSFDFPRHDDPGKCR